MTKESLLRVSTGVVPAVATGVVFAVCYALNVALYATELARPSRPVALNGAMLAAAICLALLAWHLVLQRFIVLPMARRGFHSDFERFLPFTYLVMLTVGGLLTSLRRSLVLALAMLVILAAVQVSLFVVRLDSRSRLALFTSEKYIALLFLVSGFSALIYQVVWQRVLFSSFGVNSESVTIIVSVFMFGLGVGALAGGYLQKRFPQHLLALFVTIEIGIGLFGLISVQLIHSVSALSTNESPALMTVLVYGLLAFPTLMMGATLPVLIAFLQPFFRNMGRTVGLLYACNTFGSALAAFLTVMVLFPLLGLQASVAVASLCNLATAVLVAHASLQLARSHRKVRTPAPTKATPAREPGAISFALSFFLLAAIGYISLSHEIVWYRLLGVLTVGRPAAFGLLLTAFLVGIAAGSLRVQALCQQDRSIAPVLLASVMSTLLVFYLATPLTAWTTSAFGGAAGLVVSLLAIGLTAYFSGTVLPLLMHLGVTGTTSESTQSVSWLYFGNIIGATAGPLLTGFVLLDRFTMEQNILFLTALCGALALMLIISLPGAARWKMRQLLLLLLMSVAVAASHNTLFEGYLERLHGLAPDQAFKYTLENRSGIMAVKEDTDGDIMFGGGAYDGRFNTDPVLDHNGIDRAYMIAALHPTPRRVLEIGLSTGSWTAVMAGYRPIQELVVVEINHGYPALAGHYPESAAAMSSPKVQLVFDDARRWLRNHPQQNFDLIVMNTTFHWRNQSTNLLSREFLVMAKKHLNPNGVLYFNTTGSLDAAYTAAATFSHVEQYRNFVAASDAPFPPAGLERYKRLTKFELEGQPVFFRSEAHRRKLEELSDLRLSGPDFAKVRNELWLVTDDNMAVEYRLH